MCVIDLLTWVVTMATRTAKMSYSGAAKASSFRSPSPVKSKQPMNGNSEADSKPAQVDKIYSHSSKSTERELNRWDDSNASHSTLEESASSGHWDQFSVNERLFGVKTDFNEEMYTTSLDRNSPEFKKLQKDADRIAREITGSCSSNSHVSEERLQDLNESQQDSLGEEERYSSVIRSPNSYVPPAFRKKGSSESESTPPGLPSDAPEKAKPVAQEIGSSVSGDSTKPETAKEPAKVESTKEPIKNEAAKEPAKTETTTEPKAASSSTRPVTAEAVSSETKSFQFNANASSFVPRSSSNQQAHGQFPQHPYYGAQYPYPMWQAPQPAAMHQAFMMQDFPGTHITGERSRTVHQYVSTNGTVYFYQSAPVQSGRPEAASEDASQSLDAQPAPQ